RRVRRGEGPAMTGTELPLRCQVGDCGNRAALTVTIELPVDWSASRTYNVVTLQVAACGECARDLEERGRALLEARGRFGRRGEALGGAARGRGPAFGAGPGQRLRHLADQARQAARPERLAAPRARQAPGDRRAARGRPRRFRPAAPRPGAADRSLTRRRR